MSSTFSEHSSTHPNDSGNLMIDQIISFPTDSKSVFSLWKRYARMHSFNIDCTSFIGADLQTKESVFFLLPSNWQMILKQFRRVRADLPHHFVSARQRLTL